MRQSKTKFIGAQQYTVTQLPAWRGAKLFWKLSAILVPAIAELGKGLPVSVQDIMKGGIGKVDIDLGAILGNAGNAATSLFDKMSPTEFETTLRELFETVAVIQNGMTVPVLLNFDEEMSGDMGTVLELAAFALEVNFGSFLPGLAGKAAALSAKPSSSQGSTISPTSGAVGVS